MIRHLAELSAWFLCFAVGVGLLAAFVIGLLAIWGRSEDELSLDPDEGERTVEEMEEWLLNTGPFEPIWLDFEPFAGNASWPPHTRAFPFDGERE